MKYRHIFLLVVCILTHPAGSSKYSTTHKNIRRYFTLKHLITKIYFSQKTVRMNSELPFCYFPVTFMHFVVKIEINSIYYDILKVN